VIQNFQDKTTTDVFHGANTKEARKLPVQLHGIAQRKLYYLDAASELIDLRQPPGNRLEKLQGNYSDYHSIRINDQWRLIFKWTVNGPEEVMITDYHT
jgi:proteic killer suppression protein